MIYQRFSLSFAPFEYYTGLKGTLKNTSFWAGRLSCASGTQPDAASQQNFHFPGGARLMITEETHPTRVSGWLSADAAGLGMSTAGRQPRMGASGPHECRGWQLSDLCWIALCSPLWAQG